MIIKQQYNEAKKIIDAYNEQKRIKLDICKKKLAEKQMKRENECKEHYYVDDGKWSSTQSCIFCGKTI